MPVVPKICPLMQRDYCQRENCAIWHHDRCGLIVDGVFIAQSIMGHTISQEILGEIPAKLDDLTEAIKGNSIDAALDEMSKKELEYLLELCEEEKARRQAAKNGGACND